jgi:hypothetical protein
LTRSQIFYSSTGALLKKVLQPKNYCGRLTRSQILYSSTGTPLEKVLPKKINNFLGTEKSTDFCCAIPKRTIIKCF